MLDTSRHMDAIGEIDTDGAARARRPGRRAGGPQPRRAAVRARLRAGHLDLQPGDARRHDRQQLVGQPLDRLRHARSTTSTSWRSCSPTARARRCGPGGDERAPRAIRDGLREILRDHADAIATGYPKHWRQSGGYRLDRLAREFDLAQLRGRLRGHAGGDHRGDRRRSCALPKAKRFAVGHFDSMAAAIAATDDALELGAAAVEMIDRTILELSRSKLEYRRLSETLEGDPERAAVRDVLRRQRRGGARQARPPRGRLARATATATTRCAPRRRPSRTRSRRCARPGSGC